MASFFVELRRRNVIRVGIAYGIVGWVLTEIASVIFEAFAFPSWGIQLFISFIVLGFPMALIFAWAFEVTPEGLKREKDVDRSQSITSRTGRKLDFIIIGLMAVALVYFGTTHDWGVDRTTDSADIGTLTSIAVLPFVNMSDDPANEYFSDGLSEELLNLLVKATDLRVAGRTSSFAFKNKEKDLREIGERLNVDSILEGSVRKSGNKVRITAQLVSTSDGYHLWSETYDRELTDIFEVQADIASNIVTALKGTLAGEEGGAIAAPAPTANLDAYQLYLRGRHLIARRGEQNLRNAISMFDEAIELDPEFAGAWSGSATARWLIGGYSADTYREHAADVERLATKALALDATHIEAAAILGTVKVFNFNEWAEGRRRLEAVLERAPDDAFVNHVYAITLCIAGYTEDALKYSRKAQGLDPLSGVITGWVGIELNNLGQRERAIEEINNAAALGWGPAFNNQAVYSLFARDYDRALESLNERMDAFGIENVDMESIVSAVRDSTLNAAAFDSLAALEVSGLGILPILLNVILGEYETAFRVANDVIETGNYGALFIFWMPEMAAFRQRPEFVELMTQIGLPDYWREYGWPSYCQPTGDSFTCE